MEVKCNKCGVLIRANYDAKWLVCPGCKNTMILVDDRGHELCPFCGGHGVSRFSHKKNGWRVECSNRHSDKCPVNVRTSYCLSEGQAWAFWDKRVQR